MKIIDLLKEDKEKINQTATLLQESFESWASFDLAINEVIESLQDNRISRVLINHEGVVIGWIGGQSQYNGNVWELHPLVIKKSYRRNGFGKMLVEDLEKQVELCSGVTILLGADDENSKTNVSNQNLYSEIPSFIKNFYSEDHPVNFYMKLGFVIIGIIPDANGTGKPDILMAKQVK